MKDNQPTHSRKIFTQILKLILAIYIAGQLVSIFGNSLWIPVLLICLSFYVGKTFAKWYLKKEKLNINFIEVVAWSNLIIWLIPFLAFITASATLVFNSHNTGHKEKYYFLAWTGLILGVTDAIASYFYFQS